MPDSLDALGLIAPVSRPPLPGGVPQHTAEVIDRVVASAPGREALVGRHGRFRYAELDAAANRAANALAALGVTAGARVAVCLPNDVQLPILFLATQRLGALWVGVNRLLAPPEKAYLLRDSGAHVYVTLAAPVTIPTRPSSIPIDSSLLQLPWAELVEAPCTTSWFAAERS